MAYFRMLASGLLEKYAPMGSPEPLMSLTDLPQVEVLRQLRAICFPDATTVLDATYGNGGFWADGERPTVGADALPGRALDVCMDYRQQPFPNGAFDLVLFDPPFQPHTSSKVIGNINKRFTLIRGGVQGVRESVQAGARECYRVSRLGVIVKVQDYIHSHRPVWMSAWIHEALGEPYDFVNVRRPNKLKATNWTTQKSVWRNHSTFWVYRKRSVR